ncbi:MAG TPA: hypothetical protein VM490_18855 [Armatimonadaceae bacterium]|nr:hypothetical protein [Armatimonadaceae bacterium]
MDDSLPVGEVIAATTTGFTAQVIEVPRPEEIAPVPDPPPFGAFVRVGIAPEGVPPPDDFDPFETAPAAPRRLTGGGAAVTLYGVVCHAEVGALEVGRPLTAFGLDEEELRRDQPQIFELLTARFTAALVAHAGPDGAVRAHLPPRPPRPHARVFLCGDAETVRLTERLDYLRPILLGGGTVGGVAYPADELVAALLRNARAAHREIGGPDADAAFLERAGRELAALLASDYDRLRALLRGVV